MPISLVSVGQKITASLMNSIITAVNGANPSQRNFLLNSDGAIAQRGTSFTSATLPTNGYISDRWRATALTGGTFTCGSAVTYPVTNGVKNGFRFTASSSSNSLTLGQALTSDEVARLQGKSVVFSLNAYASIAATTMVLKVQTSTTADSDYSGGATWTDLTTKTFTSGTGLTTSPAWYATDAVTVPSTAAGVRVQVIFLNIASGAVVSWSMCQLETNTSRSVWNLQNQSAANELVACSRYYVRIVAGAGGSGVPIIAWGTNVATTVADINLPLAIPMRANPTLAEVSGVGIYSTTNGSFSGGTITMSYTSQFSPVIRYTHGSAVLTIGSASEFVNTGTSAGFISISAEL